MNHASMERDEVYVPKTRTDLGIPSKEQEKEHGIDWMITLVIRPFGL